VSGLLRTLVWTGSFTIGNALLDAQHVKIVNVINEMITSHNAGGLDVHSPAFREVMNRLEESCEKHFEAEESLFEHAGPPALAELKADHQAFQRAVAIAWHKVTTKEYDDPTEFLHYLRDWWEEHIRVKNMAHKRSLGSPG
jgi:hemerythrin-like metal-binding protein